METVRLFRKYEPTISPHSRLRRLVKTSRLRLTGVLQTLETSGTVREARGFASSTNTLPSSIAYCMFMRPQNHTRREQRKCLHFHCRAVWVSENVEGFSNLPGVFLDGCQVLTPSASAAAFGHAEMRAFRRNTHLHAFPW